MAAELARPVASPGPRVSRRSSATAASMNSSPAKHPLNASEMSACWARNSDREQGRPSRNDFDVRLQSGDDPGVVGLHDLLGRRCARLIGSRFIRASSKVDNTRLAQSAPFPFGSDPKTRPSFVLMWAAPRYGRTRRTWKPYVLDAILREGHV